MSDFDLSKTLKTTPRPSQHQGSLQDQMRELRTLAIHFGLYDADDYLLNNFFHPKSSGMEQVATYFADCEAATAEWLGHTKSASRAEVKRHAVICRHLAASLQAGSLITGSPSNKEEVIKRLDKAASLCEEKLKPSMTGTPK